MNEKGDFVSTDDLPYGSTTVLNKMEIDHGSRGFTTPAVNPFGDPRPYRIDPKKRSKKKRWLIACAVVGPLILIGVIVGVVVGVTSHHERDKSAPSGLSGHTQTGATASRANVVKTYQSQGNVFTTTLLTNVPVATTAASPTTKQLIVFGASYCGLFIFE